MALAGLVHKQLRQLQALSFSVVKRGAKAPWGIANPGAVLLWAEITSQHYRCNRRKTRRKRFCSQTSDKISSGGSFLAALKSGPGISSGFRGKDVAQRILWNSCPRNSFRDRSNRFSYPEMEDVC
jgi:hypothetical protein